MDAIGGGVEYTERGRIYRVLGAKGAGRESAASFNA